MNEETFIKILRDNLKYLNKKTREEELNKYRHLDNYNLNPTEIANTIYESYGIKYHINRYISLKDAVSLIIDGFRTKNTDILKKLIIFFAYLLLLVIVIKIPFIYVRDMTNTLFGNILKEDIAYTLWSILIEFLYAIATILIFIRLIKNKALEIEKDVLNETKSE